MNKRNSIVRDHIRQCTVSVGLAALLIASAPHLSAAGGSSQSSSANHDWSGPYVGAIVGIGGLRTDGVADFNDSSSFNNLGALGDVGLLAGGTIGWNFQTGAFVFGAEADISTAGLTGSGFAPDGDPGDAVSMDVDYFGTIRARAGVADDNVLLFGTVGVAFTQASISKSGLPDNNFSDYRDTGIVLGAGIEWAPTGNMSIKVEGLYTKFGDSQLIGGEANESNVPNSLELDEFITARIGANYHFGRANSYASGEEQRDWTGPYFGVVGGAGALKTDGVFDSGDQSSSIIDLAGLSTTGGLIGGSLGWNVFQSGNLVFGVEADISKVDWSETSFQATNDPDGVSMTADSLSTVRARIGYVDGDVMAYVTAGVARLEGTLKDSDNPPGSSLSNAIDFDATGGVFGAGLEWAATDNLRVKVEGLYVLFDDSIDVDNAGSTADPGDTLDIDDAVLARLSISWAIR